MAEGELQKLTLCHFVPADNTGCRKRTVQVSGITFRGICALHCRLS